MLFAAAAPPSVRAQPALTTLVVIVLISSDNPHELARACRLRANYFILKPTELSKRLEFARLLNAWWLEYNQVPQPGEMGARVPMAHVASHARPAPLRSNHASKQAL